MIKLLTFSTLYPSSVRPSHGIFVETRLRYLLASGQVQSVVVAPVPWFPLKDSRFGSYSKFARTPHEETLNGIRVLHPRYPLLPKMGMSSAPFLLAQSAMPAIRRLQTEGHDFDAIDAHYFYPDGVAAVLLAKKLGKPVAITARGTDINLIPAHAIPRQLIRWAGKRATAMITVCEALRKSMMDLGIDGQRITTLRNGVDLERFRPVDRTAQREALGLKVFTLLSVGYLIPRKGHDLIIEALPMLPDVRLLIAGDGPELANLTHLAKRLGVAGRVTFLGSLPQTELRNYYGAVDALVLASSREGWANVLLESMACGTPVVASDVWGTPEVVAAPEAGVLMPSRTPEGIAQAVNVLRANYPDYGATRHYAEKFSWDDTTRGQLDLFHAITGKIK